MENKWLDATAPTNAVTFAHFLVRNLLTRDLNHVGTERRDPTCSALLLCSKLISQCYRRILPLKIPKDQLLNPP